MHIKTPVWFTTTFSISADVCFCLAAISSIIKGRETLTELRKSSPLKEQVKQSCAKQTNTLYNKAFPLSAFTAFTPLK